MKHALVGTLIGSLALVALAGRVEARQKKHHHPAPPPAAPAAPVDPSKLGETERKAVAQKLVVEGRTLFDKGSYTDAQAKFEEAYRLFPVPKMLFNLGVTYEALHKDGRAVCTLERFVAEAPEADPPLLKEAQEKVEKLKPHVGRVEVQAPDKAALFVDGEEQGAAPLKAPLCVEEGKHRVVALLTGVAPVGIDVMVSAVQPVKLALDPVTNTARNLSSPEVGQKPPTENPPPVATKPLWKKWWLWTAVGVVVAGGAATGIYFAARPSSATPPSADFGPFAVFR